MHWAMLQEHLAQAEFQVVEGERVIARQRDVVAQLERDGHDSTDAMLLLYQFEEIQYLHVDHRDQLRQAHLDVH
jgi:hypothetical protein